jgi:hypothetical protein
VVFGIYLMAIGAAVVLIPNVVLGLLRVVPTNEVWIRVAGSLAAAIGYYYVRAAMLDYRPFFRWTVHARLCFLSLCAAFVLLRLAPWQLLIFAAPDLAGALWTAAALRQDA